jgi:hypothetical protein
MLDTLQQNGYKTLANTGDRQALIVVGSSVDNNPVQEISSSSPHKFDITLPPTRSDRASKNLMELLMERVKVSCGETWSSRLVQVISENEELVSIFGNPAFAVDAFQTSETGLDKKFRSVAQYMKSREYRNVVRGFFFVEFAGFDMHSVSPNNNLETKLPELDKSLSSFCYELKAFGKTL